MKKKILSLIIVLVTLFTCLPTTVFAATDREAIADQVVLSFGKDETERNLAWFSEYSAAGEVRLAEAGSVVNGSFPSEYKSFSATSKASTGESGKYAKAATVTGLRENTRYAYVIAVGDSLSDIYYFNVGSFEDFDFVYIADPQLRTTDDAGVWSDALGKITNDLGADLIVSGGDQVNTATSTELYDAFITEELSCVTFAPSVGPGHEDSSPLYKEHYNLPNLSSKYGSNSTSSNYYYVYNNVLFMNLNSSDQSAFSNGEHEAFIRETMAENPDVDWNIVVTHYSLFTTGLHGEEMLEYRKTFAPKLTELGVDIVLSAHDHVYARSHLMDGLELSGDLVVGDTAYAPDGTLYVGSNSCTGTKLYSQELFGEEWVAKDDYKRKCAIKFSVTETSISMTSYHLDDMSVFDRFTIEKEAPKTIDTELNLSGVDVTLTHGVFLNFYLESPKELLGIEGLELVTRNGEPCYKVTVEVAAKEMGDTVTVHLKHGDILIGDSFTFSVNEYAKSVLSGDYDELTKAMVNALLNYGAAAQKHFGYNTDALVGVPVSDISALKAAVVADAIVEDGDNIFIGASLVLDGGLRLRFYFEGNSLGVTVNGEAVNAVNRDGYCYVELNVTPANLDKIFEVKSGNTTVKYCVLNYLKNNADNQALAETVASIYAYGVAAKAYVAEHCAHVGIEYDSVKLPTVFSEGVREGDCEICGNHVIEAIDKTEADIRKYTTSNTDSDDFYRVNVYEDILDGDHFYPTEYDPDGKSLFVEFSLLWNETLVNAYKNAPSSSQKGYALFATLESENSASSKGMDRPFWFALTNNNPELWCQYAGGVEPDNMSKVFAIIEGPTPSANGDKDDFVNIGAYGWHRVGIEYRQTFLEKKDGSIEYTVYVNLYFDGELVSSYDYILSGSSSSSAADLSYYLYTVDKVDGKFVYTDIPDNRYLSVFRIQNPQTVSGTAYFPIADMYVSCGDSFVLDVRKSDSPISGSYELESGVTVDGTVYFELVN